MERVTIRQFIEAAIIFSQYQCTHEVEGKKCGGMLQQIWVSVGDNDDSPLVNYVECRKCNTEYALLIAFLPQEEIPDD